MKENYSDCLKDFYDKLSVSEEMTLKTGMMMQIWVAQLCLLQAVYKLSTEVYPYTFFITLVSLERTKNIQVY